MNRKRITASLFALLLLGLPVSVAEEGRAVRTRPQAKKPVEQTVPKDLVMVEREAPVPAVPRKKGTDPLASQANRAARQMAERTAANEGWVEYYRVGWFRGMNRALDDPGLGEWDRVQGFESGIRDREALRTGRDLGRERADQQAGPAAAGQVEAQFRDLNRDPVFDPRPAAPRLDVDGPFAPRPDLDQIFLDMPVLSVAAFRDRTRRERFRRGFDGWDLGPDRLRRMKRYEQFHKRDWTDPVQAFRLWKRSPRNAAQLRRLREGDRVRFRERFMTSFTAWLPRFYHRFQEPAFAAGFDDGWEYGAFVQYELAFREGFAAGFDQAVAAAAERSFARSWDFAFDRFYRASFDDWMNSVRPAILELHLEDGDRNGVFEPGEDLDVFYTVANLGGGIGERDLSLDSRILERSRIRAVRFDGRGVVDSPQQLKVRISGDVPVKTRSQVVADLAGERMEADLTVARPLQFEGGWRIDSTDALSGTSVVEIEVANRSRRPVAGSVAIIALNGNEQRAGRDMGSLAAGEVRTLRFRLDNLAPLDILSGELQVRFQAMDDAVVHDGLQVRFPNLAVDLDNDDIVTLMLRFTTDRSVPQRDVDRARALMLERMKADWRIVARGRKNPYKRDFRSKGDETALGELVLRTAELRGARVRQDVLGDLGDDLAALSGDLPGAHPFLRKWFRKLAARI